MERKLRTVAADLKLDDVNQNVGDLKEQLDQLSGTARLGRALASGLAQRWQGLVLGLLLVAVAAVVVYEVTSRYAQDIAATMTRVATIVGALAAIVATVGRAATAAIVRVGEFRRSLEENLRRQSDLRRNGRSRRNGRPSKRSAGVSRSSVPLRSWSWNA